MHKTMIGLSAAAALAASTFAPVPAKADPISAWWLVPAIFGGLVVGSAATHSAYAAQRGTVYVNPSPPRACTIERQRLRGGGWREVEICR